MAIRIDALGMSAKPDLADAMTKTKPCSALQDLINTNKVNIKVTQWVERND